MQQHIKTYYRIKGQVEQGGEEESRKVETKSILLHGYACSPICRSKYCTATPHRVHTEKETCSRKRLQIFAFIPSHFCSGFWLAIDPKDF